MSTDAADIICINIPVPPECDGWRLDHFLKRRIGRLSRTKIQRIIDTQVQMGNGRRPRAATAVHGGELVIINRPAPVEPEVPRTFDVLLEDDSMLAIDKPAGLPIHTTAKFYRNTLMAVLRERYPGERIDVAHRLDRETSGVMLLARNHHASSRLKTAFARRLVSKCYLALVKGTPPDEGIIDSPMRLLDTRTRIMMGIAPDGLPAVTRYRTVRRFQAHALVEASPETGRQHQIRVHLAAIGYPIVGDKLYGAGEQRFMEYCDRGMTEELLAAFDGLPRHALHAHRVTFPHPVTRAPTTVESPFPRDLTEYIGNLD